MNSIYIIQALVFYGVQILVYIGVHLVGRGLQMRAETMLVNYIRTHKRSFRNA